MDCRACGHALDDDARFCPDCGTAVMVSCVGCGEAIAPDARFCKHCGHEVEGRATASGPVALGATNGDRPATGRERKVATMLFADVAGFTSLTERYDAEVVSRLITETFELLSAEVDRYGGTVEKFAGDAMLAVFGVPTTHEDDPERAVRAALEVQALMASRGDGDALDLQLRIGIESGQVLADLERSSQERDLFVTGDAVNVAARLQSGAEPRSVVVGPVTYASTRGLIGYKELAPRALKGKELPLASWQAMRVQARRGGMRAPLGIEAPLIGRDRELTLLKETIRRTVEAGRPHLVTVAGEAGVGKTRLIWELEKYLDGLPESYHWRKGRCYSYASVSYSPIVEAVKADARIADDDAPDDVVRKLDVRMLELGDSVSEPGVGEALRTLLGLAVDEPMGRDDLFEAWRLYLAAIAGLDPLVLIIEDIHWADDVTLDFIEFVARWGDAPMTIVCLARPELLERQATWGGGIRNAAMVELAPLDAADSVILLDELLDGALPADVGDRIVTIADGNPLFTEELVRMFVDQGALRSIDGTWRFMGAIDEVTVPDSVQAVLSARLDELGAAEKRVAQEAAVVGRIFWDVIVAHLRDRPSDEVAEALQGLRLKELVAPRTPSTLADASEWSFHHVLVRDVAYDSLPKSERGELHLQVASWAETELSDRSEEFAELVASHTEAALRYEEELQAGADAADQAPLRERTMHAAVRAARRAGLVQDRQGARRWQLVAIDQARRLDRSPLERAQLADDFYQLTGHELDAAERVTVFAEASELLEPMHTLDEADLELWGRLRAYLGQATFDDGRVDEAKEILRSAVQALARTNTSAARARCQQVLSWVLWHDYEFDEANEVANDAMAEARAAGAADVYRSALHESGIIAGFKGDPGTALERLRECLVLVEAADDRDLLIRSYVNIPSVMLNSGYALAEAEDLLTKGATMARRTANFLTLTFLLDNWAGLAYFQARFAQVLELIEEGVEAGRRAGYSAVVASSYRHKADALLALGRPGEAAQAVEVAVANAHVDPQHAEWIEVLQSRLELETEPERAIARLAGDHPQFEGYPNAELVLAFWTARLAYRTGDVAALREAIVVQDRHRKVGGPARRLEHRWAEALAAEDPAEIAGLAPELEAHGYVLYSAEALVDAALVAGRRGDGDAELERAAERVAQLDYRPMIGPLPETRWLEPGLTAGRAGPA